MFRIVFHKVFIIHDKLCRQGLFYFNVYGTGTISIIYEDYYKYDKYQKGDLRMYTGNYECLELFVKPDEGKKGSVLLKNVKESTTETKELKHIYGNWIKFPVSRNTEYEISTQDCTITFAYLSECENIMENGICVLDTTDNYKEMNKEEFLRFIDVDKVLIGNGSSVYKMASDKSSYQMLYNMGNGKAASIPYVGIVLIVLTILFVFVTTSTKYGKKVYAVGSNLKGARMAGINVAAMKISVFAICGALVGVAAFLWIAMNASCDPATTGTSYEMYAIAAVVLGGISMSGGKGRCLGILFGAMSYTVIDKIIVSLKMDSLINNAIKGMILLIVIMIQVAGPKIRGKLK